MNRPRFKRINGLGQIPSVPDSAQYVRYRKELPDDLKPRYLQGGEMTVSGDGTISTSEIGLTPSGRVPLFESGAPDVFQDSVYNLIRNIREDTDVLVTTNVIDRGLIGRVVTVASTPVLVAKATQLKGYLVTNPAATSGLTATGTILASASRGAGSSGNTQGSALGVANYDRMSLWLNISGGTGGVVTVTTQTQDPLSLLWATGQATVFSQSAVGTYYVSLGNLGIDTNFAISWAVSAAGTSTFSIGYMLKDGLAGSSSGLSNTVFLGGSSGVSTTSGYSLLEGKEFKVYFRPNTELWAISNGSVGLRVFELQ